MNRKTTYMTGALGLLVALTVAVWYSNVGGHLGTVRPKMSSPLPPAAQRFENNETEICNAVVARIDQTANECDRLHLSKTERAKRVHAVYVAGMGEIQRVNASHFRIAFNRNYPVPNVN